MERISFTESLITVWYILSLIFVGMTFDATVEWIIIISVNFIASALCLKHFVLRDGVK